MMSFNYTDEQLNHFNRGNVVYSINSDYVKNNSTKSSRKKLITVNPKNKNETNTITTSDGQKFQSYCY